MASLARLPKLAQLYLCDSIFLVNTLMESSLLRLPYSYTKGPCNLFYLSKKIIARYNENTKFICSPVALLGDAGLSTGIKLGSIKSDPVRE